MNVLVGDALDNKILLCGYFANNLGDDLFIRIICKRYCNCVFYIIESKPFTDAFLSITNVKIIPLDKIFDIKINLQVMIGGSLFMQPKSIDKIYTKFKSVKDVRIFDRIPFVIIGANFGPYTEITHYKLYKKWFLTVDDICFRDVQSYNLFKEMPNVRWAPDIVFNYTLNNENKDSKSISISCIYNNQRIGLPEYSQKQYCKKLASASIYYIEIGFNIKLASFCLHQGDTLSAYEILSFIPINYHKYVKIIEFNGSNSNEFISDFLDTKYIIGTRFHSIILGCLANIPVFPIIYNVKTYNVLKSYGFEGKYATIEDIKSCTIDFIDCNRKNIYTLNCIELINYANEQFRYIDTIFSSQ